MMCDYCRLEAFLELSELSCLKRIAVCSVARVSVVRYLRRLATVQHSNVFVLWAYDSYKTLTSVHPSQVYLFISSSRNLLKLFYKTTLAKMSQTSLVESSSSGEAPRNALSLRLEAPLFSQGSISPTKQSFNIQGRYVYETEA